MAEATKGHPEAAPLLGAPPDAPPDALLDAPPDALLDPPPDALLGPAPDAPVDASPGALLGPAPGTSAVTPGPPAPTGGATPGATGVDAAAVTAAVGTGAAATARSDRSTTSHVVTPQLLRFDVAERVVHWANATLFAILMATAGVLYLPPLSAAVGRRQLIVTIHVYAGLILPFPLVLGIVGRRWGQRLRADLHRLNRWIPEDRMWLKRRGWRPERVRGLKQGKFNAGQKLNAAFTGGAMLLMLATGSIMHWYKPWPLSWRTGSTFVHDWVAIALFFTITGHILFAFSDRESLDSMWSGNISRAWAKRRAPKWLDEELGREKAGRDAPSG
jgi:formate dehydrogenase subunit gamma